MSLRDHFVVFVCQSIHQMTASAGRGTSNYFSSGNISVIVSHIVLGVAPLRFRQCVLTVSTTAGFAYRSCCT